MAPNYLTTMSNNLKLSLPKPNTDLLKRNFSYRGAIAWNSLPSEFLREVDKSQTYFSFRNLLNNKTPAKAFTPPAEKKIGPRWSFVEEVNE